MEEEYAVDDPTQLLEAASEFANYPGVQNDASAKEFLDRFPLPVVLNALQTKADVPGLEITLVALLESIFKTRYGASLIPQYMPFIQVGLGADSQKVKSLACKTVTRLLESLSGDAISAHLITDNNIYPLLLDCLINGVFEKAKKSNRPECKKTRMMGSSGGSFYSAEPSSPSSSVSLPPLFDSSPYYPSAVAYSNNAAAAVASSSITDRGSCSHDNPTPREHVSCFSTNSDLAANTGTFSHLLTSLDLAPPPPPTSLNLSGGGGGLSDFPSLRSLQENLQLPLFFSSQPAALPYSAATGTNINGSSFDLSDWNSLGNWRNAAAADEPKAVAPAAEGDCMWTY